MAATKLLASQSFTSGEGGIRTRGGLRHTRFPILHLRPLGHLPLVEAMLAILCLSESGEGGIRTPGDFRHT